MPIPPEKVKSIVQGNFDLSVEPYEEYEKRYGLFKYLAEHLSKEMNIDRGHSVLEVGCGSGFSTVPLAEIVGPIGAIWGIDLSEAMLAQANERLKDFGDRVKLVNCDACNAGELIPGGVDRIIFTASIFLIPDVDQVLSSCFKILKPGGILAKTGIAGSLV